MGIVFVMKLEDNTNHIVSGLERSGTSLIMQILHAGASPAPSTPRRGHPTTTTRAATSSSRAARSSAGCEKT
jgi:hypothetical protein